jgi:hypothetical protein
MYACFLEIGRGFFEGMCPPSNPTAHLRDPPPTASRFANCSVPALQQVQHGVYNRAFYFLVPHQPIG